MLPHFLHNAPPELFAAFFVNRSVANDGKLVRARRYENQYRIALARFVHAEPVKFFLRDAQRIDIQFAALDINADLAGSFRFSVADRLHDLVMLKLTEKFFRSHLATNSIP